MDRAALFLMSVLSVGGNEQGKADQAGKAWLVLAWRAPTSSVLICDATGQLRLRSLSSPTRDHFGWCFRVCLPRRVASPWLRCGGVVLVYSQWKFGNKVTRMNK